MGGATQETVFTLKLKPKPPKVFIAIPTGPSKEYAVLYMLAALRGLDYNPSRLHIVFSVTDLGDKGSKRFIGNLRSLLKHGDFIAETEVIVTKPTEKDMDKWEAFGPVIKNLVALRRRFLRTDASYFWILGGDNPPPRNALKRLLALNTDVASALIYQRPMKAFKLKCAYPLVYRHVWNLQDLEHNGLNVEQKRLLRKAWVNLGFCRTIAYEKNWRRYKTVRNVAAGDGCCLVRREVIENFRYSRVYAGYQSIDIQFFQEVLAKGYETRVDMKLHCPHLDMDGKVY